MAMMMLTRGLALSCCATALWADGCPTAPDITAEMDPLYEQLLRAPDEMTARGISNIMWTYWDNAPDEPSQRMLDDGMRARALGDYATALDRLQALVSYCPFYAEGYNQRAFVNFLIGNHAAALPDLDATLALNPRHLGALSGKALTLFAMGRDAEGQEVLRAALAMNPWMSERRFLREDESEAPGEDL